MSEEVEYKVVLDPQKMRIIERIWRQDTPEKLLQSLFDFAYHYYVEEQDELVPGKLMSRKTADLEAQVADLKRRLNAKSIIEKEKQNILCPKCYSKVRYDTMSRDYACANCGWEGPPEEVVRNEEPQPNTSK
jgi:NADH pyrophosphatase NudC (nudix superfamily)